MVLEHHAIAEPIRDRLCSGGCLKQRRTPLDLDARTAQLRLRI
jgi:hypothetical protein